MEQHYNKLKAKLFQDPELKFQITDIPFASYLNYYYLAAPRTFTYPDGPAESRVFKQGLNLYQVEIIQMGTKSNVNWRRKDGVADHFEILASEDLKQGDQLIIKINETAELAPFFL